MLYAAWDYRVQISQEQVSSDDKLSRFKALILKMKEETLNVIEIGLR